LNQKVNVVPISYKLCFIAFTHNSNYSGGFNFKEDGSNYRDVFVGGDCDSAVSELCELLGWGAELQEIMTQVKAGQPPVQTPKPDAKEGTGASGPKAEVANNAEIEAEAARERIRSSKHK
jgi:hypothetical protein